MRTPPKKKKGDPILAADWNRLIECIEARTPLPSAMLELVKTAHGFTFRGKKSAPGEAGDSTPCPFGKIARWTVSGTAKVGIKGGLIACGPNNWRIEDYEINPTVAGSWLVSIQVDVVVNRDNDNEILIPGIESGTEPTAWTLTPYTGSENYPDSTPPMLPDGTGKAVLAVGILTVTIPDGSPPGTAGTATLQPTGCGGFYITHCGGDLSYHRYAYELYYY